jgi:hypothetical protein
MRITSVRTLGLSALLLVGLALPAVANTLHHHEFSPDRDSRYIRDTSPDIQNPDSSHEGGSMFRPGRHNSFNIIQDDDDVVVPPDGNPDTISQADPTVPDVPTEPVPEPGTMLLMAPAALGLWKKFRR